MTEEERLAKLEADVAALRGCLARALALVQRRGQFVPDWRGALRMVEQWVRPSTELAPPSPSPPHR